VSAGASRLGAHRLTADDGLCAAAPIIWSLQIVASKYSLTHGFTPLPFLALRFAMAASAFGLLGFWLERSFRIADRRDRLWLAAAAASMTGNQLAFAYSLRFTTAVTVAFMFGLMPIVAALLAAAVGIDRLARRTLAAGAVSFSGVCLVVVGVPGGIHELGGDLIGILLAFGTVVTYAAWNVSVARPMRTYSAYRVNSVILLSVAVPIEAIGAPKLGGWSFSAPTWAWAGVVYAAIGSLVVGNALWYRAIERVGPSRASVYGNLQPFLAVIFAALLLNETVTAVQLAGGVLIAAGIAVSRPGRPRAVARAVVALEDEAGGE